MGQRCLICNHPARPAIEADLVAKRGSQNVIAKRYDVTRRSLGRHLREHMDHPVSLAKEQEIVPLELTGTPQERMTALIDKASDILARAEAKASIDTQIRGLGELRKVVELMEKVAGRMPPDTEIRFLQVIVNDGSKTGTIESGRPEQLLLGQS